MVLGFSCLSGGRKEERIISRSWAVREFRQTQNSSIFTVSASYFVTVFYDKLKSVPEFPYLYLVRRAMKQGIIICL